MTTTIHKALRATSLITPEQLDEMASDGWQLFRIVRDSAEYVFYFRTESGL